MKRLILTMVIAIIVNVCLSQTKVKVTVSKPKGSVTVPITIPQGKTFDLDKKDEIATTNIGICKGVSYPVFANSKGKLYIKLVSEKTKKEYKKYIKL